VRILADWFAQHLIQKDHVTSIPVYKKLLNLARDMTTKIQRTPKTRLLVPVALLENLAFGILILKVLTSS
jgi:hypothetical protein